MFRSGKQGCGESWTRLGGGGALGVPERCIKTAGTSDSPGRQTACSQLTAHSFGLLADLSRLIATAAASNQVNFNTLEQCVVSYVVLMAHGALLYILRIYGLLLDDQLWRCDQLKVGAAVVTRSLHGHVGFGAGLAPGATQREPPSTTTHGALHS